MYLEVQFQLIDDVGETVELLELHLNPRVELLLGVFLLSFVLPPPDGFTAAASAPHIAALLHLRWSQFLERSHTCVSFGFRIRISIVCLNIKLVFYLLI